MVSFPAGAAHTSHRVKLYDAALDSRFWAGPLVLCHQHGPWQAESEPGAACASAQLFWVFVVLSKVSCCPLLVLPWSHASCRFGSVAPAKVSMSVCCMFMFNVLFNVLGTN